MPASCFQVSPESINIFPSDVNLSSRFTVFVTVQPITFFKLMHRLIKRLNQFKSSDYVLQIRCMIWSQKYYHSRISDSRTSKSWKKGRNYRWDTACSHITGYPIRLCSRLNKWILKWKPSPADSTCGNVSRQARSWFGRRPRWKAKFNAPHYAGYHRKQVLTFYKKPIRASTKILRKSGIWATTPPEEVSTATPNIGGMDLLELDHYGYLLGKVVKLFGQTEEPHREVRNSVNLTHISWFSISLSDGENIWFPRMNEFGNKSRSRSRLENSLISGCRLIDSIYTRLISSSRCVLNSWECRMTVQAKIRSFYTFYGLLRKFSNNYHRTHHGKPCLIILEFRNSAGKMRGLWKRRLRRIIVSFFVIADLYSVTLQLATRGKNMQESERWRPLLVK